MLKKRKVNFDRKICKSIVHLDSNICMVTDDLLYDEGKRCFEFALKKFQNFYPCAVNITKEDFGKYQKIFAIRGFAGRGTEISMCHENQETVKGICVLYGFEIYQKVGKYWFIDELSRVRKYKNKGKIPEISFPYAPTKSKFDDAFFQNPLADYVEYFGVN